MTREISWQRTGGKTHRVTITTDEMVHPFQNTPWNTMSNLGAANFQPSPEYLAYQAQMNAQCTNPTPYAQGGGAISGIFGVIGL